MLNFVYVYILGSLSIVYKGKSRVQSGENVSTAISSHRYYCRLYIPTKHYHLPGIFIRTCVYNHFLAFFFVRILSRNQGSDRRLSFGSRGQCDVKGTLNAVTLDAFSGMPVEVFMHNLSVNQSISLLNMSGRRRLEAIYIFWLVIFVWRLYKKFQLPFSENKFYCSKGI